MERQVYSRGPRGHMSGDSLTEEGHLSMDDVATAPPSSGLPRIPIPLMLVLTALTGGFYYPWWFLRRRSRLNQLSAAPPIPWWPFALLSAALATRLALLISGRPPRQHLERRAALGRRHRHAGADGRMAPHRRAGVCDQGHHRAAHRGTGHRRLAARAASRAPVGTADVFLRTRLSAVRDQHGGPDRVPGRSSSIRSKRPKRISSARR